MNHSFKNKMNYSGSFYPDNKEELLKYFSFFNDNCVNSENNLFPRAIISPHAGYIYSGVVANSAYKLCAKYNFKRVIVIGPSHRYYLNGASIAFYDSYETPLGDISIDLDYSKKLEKKYEFLCFDENTHMEHSTETQIPFIKNYFDTKVIEIVYGDIDYIDLSVLIKELLKDKENLLVISTDLSHFHTLEEANILDGYCITAIKNKSIKSLDENCEACGIVGVKALIKASKEFSLKTEFLDYKTSYEITKDKSSVVGYCSFLLGE